MNKPKLSGIKCLKIYRNLRRYFVYGIYFHKFHAICKGKFHKLWPYIFGNTFTFCTDIQFSDAIKLPKSYPPIRDDRLSNFWLAKEVRQRVKKEVAASVLIKAIKYYENTKCTLKKGNTKSGQLSCVEVLHINVGFFCAIEMHRKLNISAECECIAKYIWSQFLKFYCITLSTHITYYVSSTHKTTKIHILQYKTLTCICTVDLYS
jgi:hypothetical protein